MITFVLKLKHMSISEQFSIVNSEVGYLYNSSILDLQILGMINLGFEKAVVF